MKVEINEETMKELITTLIMSARAAGSAQSQEDVCVGMLWKYLDENTVVEDGEHEENEEKGETREDGSAQ